jgi:RNA polymerase sigma factor for flagellar operon FliA
VDFTDTSTDIASNDLVRDNLGLVGKAVSQVSARYPRHVDREELWNAGALGLVEAARRYNPDAGIPFARYAMIRIRGAIIDSTRTRDWASRSVRRKARELDQVTSDLRNRTGENPDNASLAEALGVTVEELDKIQARSAASMLLYLDHDQDGEGPTLRDSIVDPDMAMQPEMALEHREMLGTLRVAVEHLTGVHRDVVQRYYLDGELLQDIADDLQVTQARVSQIRSEALTSLRAYFGTLYETTPEVNDASPGKRARASYLAQVSSNNDWRTRLEAADQEQTAQPVRQRLGA